MWTTACQRKRGSRVPAAARRSAMRAAIMFSRLQYDAKHTHLVVVVVGRVALADRLACRREVGRRVSCVRAASETRPICSACRNSSSPPRTARPSHSRRLRRYRRRCPALHKCRRGRRSAPPAPAATCTCGARAGRAVRALCGHARRPSSTSRGAASHQKAIPPPAPRCAAPPMCISSCTSHEPSAAGSAAQTQPTLFGVAGVSVM